MPRMLNRGKVTEEKDGKWEENVHAPQSHGTRPSVTGAEDVMC